MASLSPVEQELLSALLTDGDNVPGNLADLTGRHPKSVSRSLSNLEDRGLVRTKGRGVWTLTQEGAELAEHLRDL
jgi:Mn-dependent DtxR family transcriptional regulator